MDLLNLPAYPFRIREVEGRKQIFDIFRKKYVSLTPEEWVRQHFLVWLNKNLGYPAGLISVEASLKYNNLKKRADAIIYGKNGKALLIVECKAPDVKLTQNAFDQLARYNFAFGVRHLLVTNGLNHYCCVRKDKGTDWVFLEEIPAFDNINTDIYLPPSG
ncbi:MAG TPA: type I restriction enzyme HsdR N-terminal domain-containing protein [Bacteroidales bacterium]|nr:type I restriction enzyme HsdR N-terminal domain-containing protein [Bacteroidales bacterium]